MGTIMPLLMATFNEVAKKMIEKLPAFIKYITSLFQEKMHTVTIKYSKKRLSTGGSGNNILLYGDKDTQFVIESINYFLSEHIKDMENVDLYAYQANSDYLKLTPYERKKTMYFKTVPKYSATYNNMIFNYAYNVKSQDSDTTLSETMTIKSKMSILEIKKELKKMHDSYAKLKIDKTFVPYMYKQYPHKNGSRFKKYAISNKTTFDSIFFPGKNRVMKMLENLKNGDISKFSMLLHGEPGCGKTSIIKAVANYMGYALIEVKLSFMKSDSELTNVFHNQKIIHPRNNDDAYNDDIDNVPLNKRIYIFEDIDAECDIIHKRIPEEPESVENPGKKITEDTIYEQIMRSYLSKKLTLSGILNALDGTLELNGPIVIMTTNHPEKLDSALIRPGRITMNIEMKKMTKSDANKLIQRYFKKQHIKEIKDGVFTPALLESYCQISSNIKELREMIVKYQTRN